MIVTRLALDNHFTLGLGDPGVPRAMVARVLTGAAPAAGAGFNHKVPGNQWERLCAVRFTIATSAVVATRIPKITFADADGNVFCEAPAGASLPASTTINVSWMLGAAGSQTGQSLDTVAGLPDLMLYPGLQWTLTADRIDVGDQVSNVVFYVQEYMVGAEGGLALGRRQLNADGTTSSWGVG